MRSMHIRSNKSYYSDNILFGSKCCHGLVDICSVGYWLVFSLWISTCILWIWSHIRTSWLDAGSTFVELKQMKLIDRNGELINNLPENLANLQLCPKCGLPKPERTHHCSQCDQCYFRFDHHCPVVGNCIAYKNMKAFMLFLIYSGNLFFIAAGASLLYMNKVENFIKIVMYIVTGAFAFIGIYTLGFGVTYIPPLCTNSTTLERIAGNTGTYNAGAKQNVSEVFGSWYLWIFPTEPKMSEYEWSLKQIIESNQLLA